MRADPPGGESDDIRGAGGAGEHGGAGEQPVRRARHRRRVTTEPPPGVDPTPASEPPRHALEENDQRLRDEKPPHY